MDYKPYTTCMRLIAHEICLPSQKHDDSEPRIIRRPGSTTGFLQFAVAAMDDLDPLLHSGLLAASGSTRQLHCEFDFQKDKKKKGRVCPGKTTVVVGSTEMALVCDL